MEKRVISTQVQDEDIKIGKKSKTADVRRLHWAAESQEEFKGLYRSGKTAWRVFRSCPAFLDLRDLARQRWRALLQMRWELT